MSLVIQKCKLKQPPITHVFTEMTHKTPTTAPGAAPDPRHCPHPRPSVVPPPPTTRLCVMQDGPGVGEDTAGSSSVLAKSFLVCRRAGVPWAGRDRGGWGAHLACSRS